MQLCGYQIFQNKSKKIGKRPRMYFAIFDGFEPILMIFIDQNMRIHAFFNALCQKSKDSEPDFVQNQAYWCKLNFFENFLRNVPKIVFL